MYRVPDRGTARRHRLGIGTIVSDAAMQVKYMSGANIGTIEEGFIARLRQGDCFFFAGKLLEFIRVREMAAYVKKAERHKGTVPHLAGQQDGSLDGNGRCGAGDDAARGAGRFLRARTGGGAADAPDAGAAVAHPDARNALAGNVPVARGLSSVCVSLRRTPCASRAGQPAGVAAGPRAAEHLQHVGERLRFRTGERRRHRHRPRRRRAGFLHAQPATTCWHR